MLNKTTFYLALFLISADAHAQSRPLSTEGQARPRVSAPTPAPAPDPLEGADAEAEEEPAPEAAPAPAPTPAPAAAAEQPAAAAPDAIAEQPAAAQPPVPAPAPAQPPAEEKAPVAAQPPAPEPEPAPKPAAETPVERPARARSAAPAPAAAPATAPAEDERYKLEAGQMLVNERAGTENTPGLFGFMGVFRTVSAKKGTRNSIRFGMHSGFYYLTDEWDDANHVHLEGRGHLAYSILDELEVRIDGIGTGHRAIPNAEGEKAEFIQTLGDVSLGGKYTYSINDYLDVGGLLDFRFYTKLRSMGFRWGSFSLLPMGVFTFDGREQPDLQWPVVAHANLGFFLDNSSRVLEAQDGDGLTFDAKLTASRLNALNVRTGNQILFNVGFEFPQEQYTVFLEYSTEQEVDNKIGRGVRKGSWSQSPQRFTPGVRWNFIDRLIADFAVDIAYGLGDDYLVSQVPARPTTPYQLWLGVTYSYDPGSHKVVDTRGYVKGIVVDAETGEPIGGAIIQYPGSDATRQITRDDDGNFVSFPLLPGQAKIRIVKQNYEPVVVSPKIMSRETITEKILLRKIDEGGQLVGAMVGSVLDSTAKPVAATLTFLDVEVAGTRSNPVDGSFVKILPPGQYKVRVEAEGYDTKIFLVPVEARRKTKVVFELPAVGAAEVGALAGMLIDPDGKPVTGIIRFPESNVREIMVGESGEFYATLPPGRYKIEVQSEGFGSRDYLIPIEAGKKTRVDIKLAITTVVGAVAGRVLDENNQPLAGVVKFADKKIGVLPVDPSTGGFSKVLPVGTYDVEISAPGFATQTVKVQILERKRTVQDFILSSESSAPSLAKFDGDKIVLGRPINLSKTGTTFSDADKEVLDAVAKLLKGGSRKVVVRVYTDDEGPASANFKLTQAQADAVVEYLAEKGIDKSLLNAVGGGEEKPVAPNNTPENKAKNRRVEFSTR